MFISVDFPAPFSPMMACISPFLTSKRTPFSAVTPTNDLVMLSTLQMTSATIPLTPMLVPGRPRRQGAEMRRTRTRSSRPARPQAVDGYCADDDNANGHRLPVPGHRQKHKRILENSHQAG